MSALSYCQNRYETDDSEDGVERGTFEALFLRHAHGEAAYRDWLAKLPQQVTDLDSLCEWLDRAEIRLTDGDGVDLNETETRDELAEAVLTGGGMSRYIGGVTFAAADSDGTIAVEAILRCTRRNGSGLYRY